MKFFVSLLLIAALASRSLVTGEYLRVQGTNFFYGTEKVFLSGVNIAWFSYGYDFGNGQYQGSGPTLEAWVKQIAAAGGNSLRIWIHVEGELTPEFNSSGDVIAPDRTGSFISELATFLDFCAANNVFVIPVLWNGAVMRQANYKNLILDDAKLQTYITNALIPIVKGLKGKPALAAWEIMNEPEGSVLIAGDTNPCFDTQRMGQWGAGWTGNNIPMQRFLRFINLQSAAIKREDPKALVTLGSWSEHPQSDAFDDTYNYYKDSCLTQAGGESLGTIDFYQIHSYSWQGSWSDHSPFKLDASSYRLDKPVVIGEFSADCAQNEGVEALWDHAYTQGYDGVWSWQYNAGGECSDTRAVQDQGMTRVKNYNSNGVIGVGIN